VNDSFQHGLTIALQSLGSTAEDVADTLISGGWRGFPGDAGTCPVALYLTTMLPFVRSAAVGVGGATVYTVGDTDVDVDLPPAVADFVRAFDVGAYPELVVTACDDNGDVIDDHDQ
jgi:hypothetical protein